MKTHYVYELYNLVGTIEYVGETIDTKRRFQNHIKSKIGKFYGRTDISINVVKGFDIRKDAYQHQCQLQKQYGLITDSEIHSKANKGKIASNKAKPHSIETKLKISSTMKSKQVGTKLGIKNNKPFSEEAKQKMREAAIRRWNTNKS
jgi:predicted GIY-YIG superfamily endonuclease